VQRAVEQHLSEQFRAEPGAADAARRVLERLEPELGSELCRSAGLLVAELVANAVVHGSRGPDDVVTVRVDVSKWAVRVGVADCGPGFEPRMRHSYGEDAGGGWGLFRVEQIADRWGVERRPESEVWFALDIPADAAGRQPAVRPDMDMPPDCDMAGR
jgi:anti-sigma regulatory factor (Ser/Thr protein kinase)